MTLVKKLFRMTRKRVIILDGVLTSVRNKIESNESFIEFTVPSILEEDRQAELKDKYETETKELKQYHDVLETVVCHNHDFHLETFRYNNNEWKNEWDIPVGLFVEALTHLQNRMIRYQSNTSNERAKQKYQAQIDLLQLLIEFRTEHK